MTQEARQAPRILEVQRRNDLTREIYDIVGKEIDLGRRLNPNRLRPEMILNRELKTQFFSTFEWGSSLLKGATAESFIPAAKLTYELIHSTKGLFIDHSSGSPVISEEGKQLLTAIKRDLQNTKKHLGIEGPETIEKIEANINAMLNNQESQHTDDLTVTGHDQDLLERWNEKSGTYNYPGYEVVTGIIRIKRLMNLALENSLKIHPTDIIVDARKGWETAEPLETPTGPTPDLTEVGEKITALLTSDLGPIKQEREKSHSLQNQAQLLQAAWTIINFNEAIDNDEIFLDPEQAAKIVAVSIIEQAHHYVSRRGTIGSDDNKQRQIYADQKACAELLLNSGETINFSDIQTAAQKILTDASERAKRPITAVEIGDLLFNLSQIDAASKLHAFEGSKLFKIYELASRNLEYSIYPSERSFWTDIAAGIDFDRNTYPAGEYNTIRMRERLLISARVNAQDLVRRILSTYSEADQNIIITAIVVNVKNRLDRLTNKSVEDNTAFCIDLINGVLEKNGLIGNN